MQLASGLWLAHALRLPLSMPWLKWALVLFFVVGACWLPVVWLQIRARDLAAASAASNAPLSARYRRIMRGRFWLGWPAFLGVIAIFWLMVAKPA